ncbi:hypothetical protein ACJVDH_02570 [Pedobacter sp. AW1-32]|uniref:hypothetical protein n=1 Tax=Pedobacter sp. AW1-32 TaxID=3383026 RepID=UPI003FED8B3E
MKGCKLHFKITLDQLDEIRSWLVEEEKASGEGFLCNWSSIAQSYQDKKLGILTMNKQAIGFITWFEWEKVARIQLAEIRLGYRRNGYGKYIAEELFFRLERIGIKVVDLHCQPASSEKIWKRLGFKRFPEVKDFERENSTKGRYLYKILVPHLKPTRYRASREAVKLWYSEPHIVRIRAADLIWHPKFEKGTRNLIKPIIHPAKRDWQISWDKLTEISRTDKIKYFSRNEIDFGNFIFINTLPLS